MKIIALLCMILFYCSPFYAADISLSEQEKAYLKKLGVISVCVDPDWEPFESLDSNGNYSGIGADLLFLIAERLGIPIQIVKTKDWDASVEASKKGQCQLISFLNQTAKRDEWLLFTQVHFTDPNVFITREEHPFIADLGALIHETIVFPHGTAMEEFVRHDYPNLRILTTTSELEAFELVSHKKADIAMRSLIVAAYTIKKEGLFNLKIAGQLPNYSNQLRMGVIKSEPMLRDILDKGIASLTKQDKASIVNKYISIKAETVRDYGLILKILLGFLLLSLFAVYRYYELKRYNKELLYLSETDILTKIYNRTKIDKKLLDEVARAYRYQEDLSILLIDVDFFKKVNDKFGHPMGDKVLIQIAQIIQKSIRNYDLVGRWGGEEFLVICPKSHEKDALLVAQRIQSEISHGDFDTHQIHTVSIGIAQMQVNDTPYTLVSNADNVLYQAKREGRNCIRLFK
ncbi:MAG: diguanylate cyclase [Sulfurospirillaceae bacterium]|nr:diguanylate cyclase [Sulfurospirillaceae bacterium]